MRALPELDAVHPPDAGFPGGTLREFLRYIFDGVVPAYLCSPWPDC